MYMPKISQQLDQHVNQHMRRTRGHDKQEGGTDRRGRQMLSWGDSMYAIGVPCIKLGLPLPGLSSPLGLHQGHCLP